MMTKRLKERLISTPDSRKQVWERLAQFLAKVWEMNENQIKAVHERELGFQITKWNGREDAIVRICYVMSKKIIEG